MNQIEKLLAERLASDPADWALRLELARSLFNRGAVEEAADLVGQAPDLPGDTEQLLESARLVHAARPRTAEIMLQAVLAVDPENAEALDLLSAIGAKAPKPRPEPEPEPEPITPVAPAGPVGEAGVNPSVYTGAAEAAAAGPVTLNPQPLQKPPQLRRRVRSEPLLPTAAVLPEDAGELAPQPAPDAEAVRREALLRTGLVTARPFPEQEVQVQVQRVRAVQSKEVAKKEKLSAMAIAVFVHVVLFLILGVIVLSQPRQEAPAFTVYAAEPAEDPVLDKKEVIQRARKPSSASAERMKTITTEIASPVTLASLDVPTETFAPIGMGEVGVGMAFGGAQLGDGFTRSGASAFGYAAGQKSDLVGTFYDIKQDRRGKPRENPNIVEEVRGLIEGKFSDDLLGNYFRAPRKLYLSHLVVPVVLAEEAPRLYGVERDVEPGQWFIHYEGKISAHRTGSYRFVGKGDDILVVMVNGKVVLDGSLPGQNPTDFRTTEPDWHHQSPQWDGELVYGEWFPVTKGRNVEIDIVFGENPGGHLSGFLLVERRGGKYEIASDGRPVLPPFAVGPIPESEWERFKEAASGGADPKLAYSPFDFARELELMTPAPER